MARTQKNKATAFHLGMRMTEMTFLCILNWIADGCEGQLKAKLAKLKRELLTPSGGGGGGGGKWIGRDYLLWEANAEVQSVSMLLVPVLPVCMYRLNDL